MKYVWLILTFYCTQGSCDFYLEQRLNKQLLDTMAVVIKDTNSRIGYLSEILQTCHKRPSFEVGYLMYVIQERYRRMVDKYHTALFMRKRYFVGEFVNMLVEVEFEYWEIEHIGNMLHEIERKYNVKGGLNEDYELPPTTETTTVATKPTLKWRTKSRSMRKKHFNQRVISSNSLSDLKTKILNEISLPIKLQLLKDVKDNSKDSFRRVGVQAYRMEKAPRDDEVELTTVNHDESNMKMKLFRLMYEAIRDSDVKIKRAEVIKKFYNNSTSFNLGFMMGEITERFNVMRDIAQTMKRMYAEWKPMEHINAYEQIANKAVELCNMVDVARSMLKHDSNYTGRYKHKKH